MQGNSRLQNVIPCYYEHPFALEGVRVLFFLPFVRILLTTLVVSDVEKLIRYDSQLASISFESKSVSKILSIET